MGVAHVAPDLTNLNTDVPSQMVNAGGYLLDHPGIGQFRVGTVTVTILDTAVAVTFASPLPSTSYQVFIQPKSNVSVVTYPSNLAAGGFTLNLSVGVAATFAYFAVEM